MKEAASARSHDDRVARLDRRPERRMIANLIVGGHRGRLSLCDGRHRDRHRAQHHRHRQFRPGRDGDADDFLRLLAAAEPGPAVVAGDAARASVRPGAGHRHSAGRDPAADRRADAFGHHRDARPQYRAQQPRRHDLGPRDLYVPFALRVLARPSSRRRADAGRQRGQYRRGLRHHRRDDSVPALHLDRPWHARREPERDGRAADGRIRSPEHRRSPGDWAA